MFVRLGWNLIYFRFVFVRFYFICLGFDYVHKNPLKFQNLGKGSLWTVDQQYKPNLLQALTRSPFHPCSTLDPTSYFNKSRQSPEKSSISRLPNPELFPYLSRTLAATEMNKRIKIESDDSLDAVDAATVMLSLKNGHVQKKSNVWQVITASPSQDHTYSAAVSDTLNCAEAFDSDEERCEFNLIPTFNLLC